MTESTVVFSHVLFFGRKYEEVLSLFDLKEEDLYGRKVLDCNSGPDVFVSEANKRGFEVTGCDPLYEKTHEELRAIGLSDIEHSFQHSQDHEETTGNLDVESFNRLKREALEAFLTDFTKGKELGWYVAGALPQLPFDDASFDLVLSAHFLFIASHPRYGGMIDTETFDLEFHRRAVRELLRVCRRELRLFPITKIGQRDLIHPWAAILMGELAAEGFELTIQENTYDQGQYTGNHVLIIHQRSPGTRI